MLSSCCVCDTFPSHEVYILCLHKSNLSQELKHFIIEIKMLFNHIKHRFLPFFTICIVKKKKIQTMLNPVCFSPKSHHASHVVMIYQKLNTSVPKTAVILCFFWI